MDHPRCRRRKLSRVTCETDAYTERARFDAGSWQKLTSSCSRKLPSLCTWWPRKTRMTMYVIVIDQVRLLSSAVASQTRLNLKRRPTRSSLPFCSQTPASNIYAATPSHTRNTQHSTKKYQRQIPDPHCLSNPCRHQDNQYNHHGPLQDRPDHPAARHQPAGELRPLESLINGTHPEVEVTDMTYLR
jgi:hypothetical protein